MTTMKADTTSEDGMAKRAREELARYVAERVVPGVFLSLSIFHLFDEFTTVPATWKEPLLCRGLIDGVVPLLDPHPDPRFRHDEQLVFHTLVGRDTCSKKNIAFEVEKAERLRRVLRRAWATEEEFQQAFVENLREANVVVAEQVRCATGRADVVDDTWVYELKLAERDAFHAVGQAVLYGAELRRKPCVVLPAAPRAGIARAMSAANVRLWVFGGEREVRS